MTKLEQEISTAIYHADYGDSEYLGKMAADMAKKYIEKAYDDAVYQFFNIQDAHKTQRGRKAEWLKENGVSE